MPEVFARLRRDRQPECTSDDEEIPNLEDATVLDVRTQSEMLGNVDWTPPDTTAPEDANEDAGDDPSEDKDELLDVEDL